MRALIWDGPQSMACREVPDPVAEPGQAIVRVDRVGICGSDVSAYRGRMGISRPGDIRGHELSGTVVDVGAAADERWVGTPVAVNAQLSCRLCAACVAGHDNHCLQLQILGVHRPGGFAELVAVPLDSLAIAGEALVGIPASTAEPLAQACHDVRLVLGRHPQSALVIGAGSIGSLVLQAASLLGIAEIAVVEPDSARRTSALAAGASAAFASVAEAGVEAGRLPAGGFDAVFDVVGTETVRAAAVDLAGNGAQVVLVGLHTDVSALPWFSVIRREVSIHGANCYDRSDFALALGWLANGRIRLPQPAREVPLRDGPACFAELAAEPVHGMPSYAKTYLVPGAPD